MKFYLRPVLFILFLAAFIAVSAQSKSCAQHPVVTALATYYEENNNDASVVEPYDGSYRFIFTKGVKQVFTDEIFKIINASRKKDEDVIVVLSDFCKLEILSEEKIHSPSFVPFSKPFVFE